MKSTHERINLLEKLFDQAFNRKLAQWVREYASSPAVKSWILKVRNMGGREYFRGWKWTADMTVKETMRSLDKYLNGLQPLVARPTARHTKGHKKRR